MIECRIDKNSAYSEKIKKMLRAHNVRFTGPVSLEERHFYIEEKGELLGALKVRCFWDWATIGEVYYENLSILSALVWEAWRHFGQKAVGMKFFTPVKSRFEDFLEVGFSTVATVQNVGGFDYYYADLCNKNVVETHSFPIRNVSELPQKYRKRLAKHTRSFNERHGIEGLFDTVQIVALEKETFLGGVQCEVYSNTMHITRLVVDANYRNRAIGKTLIDRVLEEALKRKVGAVELGTTDFQGRAFYEKQGFEVVHTRKDNPKGFDSHTMIKRL